MKGQHTGDQFQGTLTIRVNQQQQQQSRVEGVDDKVTLIRNWLIFASGWEEVIEFVGEETALEIDQEVRQFRIRRKGVKVGQKVTPPVQNPVRDGSVERGQIRRELPVIQVTD